MTVKPTDELGRSVTTRQVLAGNAQTAVGLRAAGEHHGVVYGPQVGDGNVTTDTHVAKKVEPRGAGDTVVHQDRFLELRMVGSHAAANQTERRRQALDHVHLHRKTGTQQGFRRIKAARAGSDYCDMNHWGSALHAHHQDDAKCGGDAPLPGCFAAIRSNSVAKLGAPRSRSGKRILFCVDHG